MGNKILLTQEMENFLRENIDNTSYNKLTIKLMNKYNIDISHYIVKRICTELGILYTPKRTKYTKDQIEFIRNNYKNISYKELTNIFNKKFNESKTVLQIRGACRFQKLNNQSYYTEEQIKFIKNNYKGISHKELTNLFNENFNESKTVTKKILFTQEIENFLRENIDNMSYNKLIMNLLNKYNIDISMTTFKKICTELGIYKSKRAKYTKDQIEFIRNNYKNISYKELTNLFNKKFNELKTIQQIRGACRVRKLNKPRVYTKEQIEFIKNNYKNISHKELTNLFNKKFNESKTVPQIKRVCGGRKLLKNINIKYTEEHIKWLKDNVPGRRWDEVEKLFNEKFSRNNTKKQIILTCFQRGIRNNLSEYNNGYICHKHDRSLIKLNGKWYKLNRVIWEKAHGRLPKDKVVIFADSNNKNFSVDNLLDVTRAEICILNTKNMIFTNPELTKTGLLIAKLLIKIKERQKELSMK